MIHAVMATQGGTAADLAPVTTLRGETVLNAATDRHAEEQAPELQSKMFSVQPGAPRKPTHGMAWLPGGCRSREGRVELLRHGPPLVVVELRRLVHVS